VKLPSALLVIVVSLATACAPKQRSSTGVAFASLGGMVSVAGLEGMQGSSADEKSNDAAVTVLVAGLAFVLIGAVLYADAKKGRHDQRR